MAMARDSGTSIPPTKASESFSRSDFDKLTVYQALQIARAAHVCRVRFDYGQIVNTEDAAESMRRAFDDLAEALDGTLEKHIPVRRKP
jgi:ribosome-associated translation inhibitor RaiA